MHAKTIVKLVSKELNKSTRSIYCFDIIHWIASYIMNKLIVYLHNVYINNLECLKSGCHH